MKMNQKQLLSLLKIGEGVALEFKESMPNNLGKEICAFANAQGGKIILGVTDLGAVVEIKSTNALISQIQSYARNIDPSLAVGIEEIANVISDTSSLRK